MDKLTKGPRRDLVVVSGPPQTGKTALLMGLMSQYWPLMQQAIVETTAFRFPPMENHYRQISAWKFKERQRQGEYMTVKKLPEGKFGILVPEDRLSVAVLDLDTARQLIEEAVRTNMARNHVHVLPILLWEDAVDSRSRDRFALRFSTNRQPITEIEKGVRHYIDMLLGGMIRTKA